MPKSHFKPPKKKKQSTTTAVYNFKLRYPPQNYDYSKITTKQKALQFFDEFRFGIAMYKFLPEIVRKEEQITAMVLYEYPENIIYVPDVLKSNREFMLDLMNQKRFDYYPYLPEELQLDVEFIKLELMYTGEVVRNLDPSFKDDEDFMYFAVQSFGYCFGFASERLKKNHEFLIKCSLVQPLVLDYIDEDLITEEFLSELLPQNGMCLEYLQHIDHSEKEFLQLKAVKNNGLSLKFIKNPTRKVAVEALNQTWKAIEFAPDDIKNDQEMVSNLIKEHGDVYLYISKRLKNDRMIIIAAVQSSPSIHKFVPKKYATDQEIIWISKNGNELIRNIHLYMNINFHFNE